MKLELTHKTSLTPALQTSMHLLQLNNLQLRTYLGELMLGNALAEMDFPEIDCGADPFNRQLRASRTDNSSAPLSKEQLMASKADNTSILHDLFLQVSTLNPTPAEQRILEYLLYSLDENGFLPESAVNIARVLSIPAAEIAHCIDLLQGLEPAGIGASCLKDCLRLQLLRLAPEDTLALDIVAQHLEQVAKLQYSAIAKALGVSKAEVMQACVRIRALNPKPLNGLSCAATEQYIIPDFYVLEEDGQLHISINDYYLPKITVNPDYVKLIQSNSLSKADHEYMQRDYKQVNDIIHFLSYRKSTLQRIVEYVVKKQEAFFLLGEGHRTAMNYHELAQALSLHESTISRAVNGKFFQCKWGVFPLRSLFPHRVGSTEDGTGLDQIMQRIRQLIESEPTGAAYSDQQLVTMLETEGFHIARRTAAKYRQQLGFPTAGKRNAQNNK